MKLTDFLKKWASPAVKSKSPVTPYRSPLRQRHFTRQQHYLQSQQYLQDLQNQAMQSAQQLGLQQQANQYPSQGNNNFGSYHGGVNFSSSFSAPSYGVPFQIDTADLADKQQKEEKKAMLESILKSKLKT